MKVKMYTCGPSTYQRAHIGNYRTFLFEDVLQRYLEYLGYSVIRLITLTNAKYDLDVKAAFDELYRAVAQLCSLVKQNRLSAKDANTAAKGLHKIDSVLQVIF